MLFKPGCTYFFDSHGGLWVSCESDHAKACAFGPTGMARPITLVEIGLVITTGPYSVPPPPVPYVVLSKLGLVKEPAEGEEWATVDTTRQPATAVNN